MASSTPIPSSFPFTTVEIISTIRAPAQGRDIEYNQQNEYDEQCNQHDGLLFQLLPLTITTGLLFFLLYSISIVLKSDIMKGKEKVFPKYS